MERHFDEELSALKNEILNMGLVVEAAIEKSIEALKKLSKAKANAVITGDKSIDEMENKIDEMCIDLLALRQPMASDLRFIAMSMKISTDLERMADLAVDIAQRVLDLSGKPLLKPLVDIPRLAVLSKEMARDSIEAFLNKNIDLAKKTIMRDSEADKLRNLVQSELLNDYIQKDPLSASRAIPLLLVARHLERICDHATNIAEDAIYMVEAEVVKHHLEKIN